MISRASLVPILGLLSLLAAGCAPAVHVPLKAEDAGKIQGTRVRAVVVQEEINAAVQQSNIAAAGGGGLLLGLIDAGVEAHRTSKAKTLVEPIRKEVTAYDFRARFGEALQATATTLPALKITEATTTPAPLPPNDPAAIFKDVTENAVLTLTTTYELSANFRALIVTTVAALWRRDQPEPVYRGRYLYHTPPVVAATEVEASAAAWAANRGAALRAAMQQGIAETMKMLVLDLNGAPAVATATPKLSLGSTSGLMSFPAYLAKDGNRYIVRVDGALTSASSDATFAFVPAPPQ